MAYKFLIKLLSCFLVTTTSIFGYGCASQRSIPLETHFSLHKKNIAIISGIEPIEYNLNLYAKSRIEGALKGAGSGFAKTLSSLGDGSCEGPFCGAVVLLYLGAAVIGGTVGSIYGAATSPSGNKVEVMEKGLHDKTLGTITQKTFSQLLADKASINSSLEIELVHLDGEKGGITPKEYEYLKGLGFQTLISVNLVRIEFKGGKGKDPPLALALSAVAEITDLEIPGKVIRRDFEYLGQELHYNEWMAKDADELKRDFHTTLNSLVDDVYDDIFVNVELPIASGYFAFFGSDLLGCCWLCPEDHLRWDYSFWESRLEYPVVDSLKPRISWLRFPDDRQARDFSNNTGQYIENVNYDFRIWEAEDKLIYEARNIQNNSHQIKNALKPNTEYFWSVRACFVLAEKKEICTRWASRASIPPNVSLFDALFKDQCERTHIPFELYFRFRTPLY